MRFLYHKIASLPRLAWCAVMHRNQDVIDVFHGPWVEVRDCFFVEGAWEGKFSDGGFDQSYLLMGSGGRTRDNEVVFCTPCHVHERLHVIQTGLKLFVSPSLAFVLTMAHLKLDENYIHYQVDLLNMLFKMANHVGSIPTKDGERINIYHYRNVAINGKLNITVEAKPEPPEFTDFANYKGFLIRSLDSIHKNANEKDRHVKYSLLSTLSSGYDSTACTAIATEIGCQEVVTFRDARPEKKRDIDDSGEKIGEKLGVQVKEYDRLEVLNKKGMPEAEFVACGDLGQDFHFAAFENDLNKKILIVGCHGDKVWDRLLTKPVKKDIILSEASGSSLIEFKFRVGFIYVPLAYFGCLSLPSIHRISNSEEMKPWSVKGRYDRPIARRIAEEKGVGRYLFGQSKKATTILLNRHDSMLSGMNPNSAESFEEFYQNNKNKRNRIKQALYDFMFSLWKMHRCIFWRFDAAFRRLHIPVKVPCAIPDRFTQCPGRPSFLVHWGISQIESRYEIFPDSHEDKRTSSTK